MKLMIASDIHGSYYYFKKLIEAFEKENPHKLLLLGDILYHGPRNDLPRDYAPKKIIPELNTLKDVLLCVRGNCDTEVDQMVLDFPILADYCIIQCGNKTVYATHGHNFGETTPPPLGKGSILLGGHTHVPKCEEYENYTYMNPGSVSIPKEDSHHGYMIYENNKFLWKNLEGDIISEYNI